MAEKVWQVVLNLSIREGDFIVRAIRTVHLPFVPSRGLSIGFKNWQFTINGLDYDYEGQIFTAYSSYPTIEDREEFDAVIAVCKKNGFEIFDSGPKLAARKGGNDGP